MQNTEHFLMCGIMFNHAVSFGMIYQYIRLVCTFTSRNLLNIYYN